MVIKNSRAQRRHDYSRIKIKRQFHWGYGHICEWAGRTPAEAGEINYMPKITAGFVVNTPTPCSCWMCKNLRKVGDSLKESLTRQELKALDSYADGIIEYNL